MYSDSECMEFKNTFLWQQGKGQNLDDYSNFEAKAKVDNNVNANVKAEVNIPKPRTGIQTK